MTYIIKVLIIVIVACSELKLFQNIKQFISCLNFHHFYAVRKAMKNGVAPCAEIEGAKIYSTSIVFSSFGLQQYMYRYEQIANFLSNKITFIFRSNVLHVHLPYT